MINRWASARAGLAVARFDDGELVTCIALGLLAGCATTTPCTTQREPQLSKADLFTPGSKPDAGCYADAAPLENDVRLPRTTFTRVDFNDVPGTNEFPTFLG